MTDDPSDDRDADGEDEFSELAERRRRTEPTAEERERAARIRRLRDGEAEPRQRRRRPEIPDEADLPDADEADDAGGAPEGGSIAPGGADRDVAIDHEGPAQPAAGVDLPGDAPSDLTAASMYLTNDLRGKLERIEEHLHLRYSVEYDTDLDGPRYVRPLATYLGVRQLERLDLEEIRALFHEVEVVEAPD